jgi:hypothetical protein
MVWFWFLVFGFGFLAPETINKIIEVDI